MSAKQPRLCAEALEVLAARYLRREGGRVVESPLEMFGRVARSVAAAEATWNADAPAIWESRFLHSMVELRFLPNSPALFNAGSEGGLLPACYVVPLARGSAAERAFDVACQIHLQGAGTGFSLTGLGGGKSPGPLAFLHAVDRSTVDFASKSPRCGANMGVLEATHPDVLSFVGAKRDVRALRTFNLSVAVTDTFMQAAERGDEVDLFDRVTHAVTGSAPADRLLAEFAHAAWETGDPGLLFLDAIEAANPTPRLGRLQATNPCGEVPLLPGEACFLGSVNLAQLLQRDGPRPTVDFEALDQVVRLGARILDDVIEATAAPNDAFAEATRATRKIGLGVMGLAELLAELEIPYDSEEAVRFGRRLMRRIRETADDASARLAAERGPFPAFPGSRL